MDRVKMALLKHEKGYNCAQAVACTFCDKTEFSEDQLFKLSEAFGGGMGGMKGVCGAVSAMVLLAGLEKSLGVDSLPSTNKLESYDFARQMIEKFESANQTILCSKLKGENLRSCNGCIEDAVRILEDELL